jgi:hypothetical protein
MTAIGCPPDPQGPAPRLIRHAHYDAIVRAQDVPAEAAQWIRAEVARFPPQTPVLEFSDGDDLLRRLEALDR